MWANGDGQSQYSRPKVGLMTNLLHDTSPVDFCVNLSV
jgi:hypothetical protein